MSRLIVSLLSAIVLIAPIAAMASDDSEEQERDISQMATASLDWMAACEGDNGETGTCMSKNDCLRRSGTASGLCANRLGVCCTANLLCGQSTSMKRSVIPRPSGVESPCTYTINATSNHVCQLRIDFEQLHLAPPTIVDGYMQCADDSFTVSNSNFKLCGENAGQHIYLPFDSSNGMELTFTMVNRFMTNNLPIPNWRLKVTQLECTLDHNSIQYRQQEPDKFRERRSFYSPDIDDAFWIAPHGCLQYFPQPSGVVESFNFDGGNGVYMGNMRYSICFRRTTGDSLLKLNAQTFILPFNMFPASAEDLINAGVIKEGYDNSCLSATDTENQHEDYVLITEGVKQSDELVRASRFCGRSIHESTVIASQPGPFQIQINSDHQYTEPTVDDNGNLEYHEIGFKFNYQIL